MRTAARCFVWCTSDDRRPFAEAAARGGHSMRTRASGAGRSPATRAGSTSRCRPWGRARAAASPLPPCGAGWPLRGGDDHESEDSHQRLGGFRRGLPPVAPPSIRSRSVEPVVGDTGAPVRGHTAVQDHSTAGGGLLAGLQELGEAG
jgi:hypothetical protein